MMRRLFSIVVMSLLAGMFSPHAFGQDNAKLEYKFTPGEVQRYQVILEMTVSSRSTVQGAGHAKPVKVKMSGIRDQQIKQVLPNGDAEIIYRYESMKVGMGDALQETPSGELPGISMIVGKDGVVKSIRGLEKTGPFAQMPFLNIENLNQYLGVLPSVVPKADATWMQKVPFPSRDGKQSTGNMKIDGKILSVNEPIGAITAVKFRQEVDGKQEFSMPLPANADGTSTARMMNSTGTIKATAVNYFSPDTGRTVLTEGNGLVKLYSEYMNDKNERVAALNTGVLVKYQIFLITEK